MAGIKRIIIGLIIMISGLYMWFGTLNENIQHPDSLTTINAENIIDSTVLFIIQGIIIAIGAMILASGSMAARK